MIKKYNSDTIRNLQLFTKVTSIQPLDCFEAGNHIIFILPPNSAPKAIGKQGKNIKQIKNSLQKEVKVVEKADSIETLIKNFLFPLKTIYIKKQEDNSKVMEIKFQNRNDRRILLNNQQELLKCLKKVVEHYYKDIEDIRVL